MTTATPWIPLPNPPALSPADARAFLAAARDLASLRRAITTGRSQDRRVHPALAAATCVLADLVDQGWAVRVDASQHVAVRPPKEAGDPAREKARVRNRNCSSATSSWRSPRSSASWQRWSAPGSSEAGSCPSSP